MRISLFIIIGGFFFIAFLVNLFLREPTFKTPQDEILFDLQSKQPKSAESIFFDLLKKDSLNIDLHYRYIHIHFEIPEKKKIGKDQYEYRDDGSIAGYYFMYTQSSDSTLADIGNYGLGLISSLKDEYNVAENYFKLVRNKRLKYLNNSIGFILSQENLKDSAEKCFRKEITQNGHLGGAYFNLFYLLLEKKDYKQLNSYFNDASLKKYFPSEIERMLYFRSFRFLAYVSVLLKNIFSAFNFWGFAGAFLIMGSWTMYLRKLDIFEIEKWKHIVFTASLGMIFSFGTFFISDFNRMIFDFRLNGGVLNDIFYSVLGIGAVEEFFKIIPLLLMIRFTNAVNEPYDYILYASISALGFAFVENLMYFNQSNLNIIHARGLLSSVSHMFDSSIIAYGLILNKYKRRKNPYLNFLLFFFLAALAHGFYDFWLINKSVSGFSILTFLFLFVSLFIWQSFKNNALNQSTFFDHQKMIDGSKLQDYLLYSLSSIFLLEYIALSVKFGPGVGNKEMLGSLSSGLYMLMIFSTSLSKFTILKGEWAPIRYWQTGEHINFDSILNVDFTIKPFSDNAIAEKYLPNEGIATRRLTVSNEADWYLIKLKKPCHIDNEEREVVLIRTKDKSELIRKGNKTFIAFFHIPDLKSLENEACNRTDFIFCGWATIE